MYWKYFGCCVYKDTNRNIRYVNIFSWTKTVWWSVARRCKRVQLNSNKRWIKHSLSKQGLLPGDALISSLSVCQECEGFCPLPRTFFPWHEMQKVTKSQLSRHSLALHLWFLKLWLSYRSFSVRERRLMSGRWGAQQEAVEVEKCPVALQPHKPTKQIFHARWMIKPLLPLAKSI